METKTEIKVEFINRITNLCVLVDGEEYNYCETEGELFGGSEPNPHITDDNCDEVEDEKLVARIIGAVEEYKKRAKL